MDAVRSLRLGRPRQLSAVPEPPVRRPALLVFLASAVAAAPVVVVGATRVLETDPVTSFARPDRFVVQLVLAATVVAVAAGLAAVVAADSAARASVRLQALAGLLLFAVACVALYEHRTWTAAAPESGLVAALVLVVGACAFAAVAGAAVAGIRLTTLLRARRRAPATTPQAYLEQLDAQLRTSGRVRRRIVAEVADHFASAEEAGGLQQAVASFGEPADVAAAFERRAAVASLRGAAWLTLITASAGIVVLVEELRRNRVEAFAPGYVTWAKRWGAPVGIERSTAASTFPLSYRSGWGLAVVAYALLALGCAVAAVLLVRRPARARGLLLAAVGSGALALWQGISLARPWAALFGLDGHEERWAAAALCGAAGVCGVLVLERVVTRPSVGSLLLAGVILAAPLPLVVLWHTPTAYTGEWFGSPDAQIASGDASLGRVRRGGPAALAKEAQRGLVVWVGTREGKPLDRQELRAGSFLSGGSGPVVPLPLSLPRVPRPGLVRSVAITGPVDAPTVAWLAGRTLSIRDGAGLHVARADGARAVEVVHVRRQALVVVEAARRSWLLRAPHWDVPLATGGAVLAARTVGQRVALVRRVAGGIVLELYSSTGSLDRRVVLPGTKVYAALGSLGEARVGLAYSAVVRGRWSLRLVTVHGRELRVARVAGAHPCERPLSVGLVRGRAAVFGGWRCGARADIAIGPSLLVRTRGGWAHYVFWLGWAPEKAWLDAGSVLALTRWNGSPTADPSVAYMS
jgi:hypothetical protein